MAHFDLSSPDARRAFGLPTVDTVSILSRSRKAPRRYRDRADSKQCIMQVVSASTSALTRREIAVALDRAKSPGLLQMIEELVAEGLLVKLEDSWRGVVMWRYMPVRHD